MFQDFFHHVNAYLLHHPPLLAKLKFLFWIKYWALTLVMVYFLYLLFRERGLFRRPGAQAPGSDKRRHCFKA